jgi:hypothetical protein
MREYGVDPDEQDAHSARALCDLVGLTESARLARVSRTTFLRLLRREQVQSATLRNFRLAMPSAMRVACSRPNSGAARMTAPLPDQMTSLWHLGPPLTGDERATLTRIVQLAGSVDHAAFLIGLAPQTIRTLLTGETTLRYTTEEFRKKAPTVLARVEKQPGHLGPRESVHFERFRAHHGERHK